MLCSKFIIFGLTAGRYVESASFANILCFKNVTTTFAYLMSGVLIGYGFPKLELINRVIGSLIAVILYYVLISYLGFYGAAWGQCLSWLFMGCISLLCLLITFKFKRNDIKYSSTSL
jgi:Na+-driven multidrug efflux pump